MKLNLVIKFNNIKKPIDLDGNSRLHTVLLCTICISFYHPLGLTNTVCSVLLLRACIKLVLQF